MRLNSNCVSHSINSQCITTYNTVMRRFNRWNSIGLQLSNKSKIRIISSQYTITWVWRILCSQKWFQQFPLHCIFCYCDWYKLCYVIYDTASSKHIVHRFCLLPISIAQLGRQTEWRYFRLLTSFCICILIYYYNRVSLRKRSSIFEYFNICYA